MDYFQILGVDRDAAPGEIKRAYRKRAFKYHPDRNNDPSAKEKYDRVLNAYKILKDPVKRQAYVSGTGLNITDDPAGVTAAYWKKMMIVGKVRAV